MSDQAPALTAEEWEARRKDASDGCGEAVSAGAAIVVHPPRSYGDDEAYPVEVADDLRHAVAALALYGQPFGFTADDVRMLRVFASPPDLPPFGPLLDLAARIAALLPPAPTTPTLTVERGGLSALPPDLERNLQQRL